MGSDSGALHRSFIAVDVEGFGDPARTTAQRRGARSGMYQVLMRAFADVGLPWDDKSVEDAGDSLIVLLPPDVAKAVLADRLPGRLAAALRDHNQGHSVGARLRLRMALHAGEVHYDERGKTSADLILASRILDAAEAKRALRDSTAPLVVIVSDPFYQSVIRDRSATRPDAYRPVDVRVKEISDQAWVRLVDADTPRPATGRRAPTSRELNAIVDALLRTPGFDTHEKRDLVLHELPFAASIARHSSDRADTFSIVRMIARYPGGLEALRESINFHAAGNTAVAELDTLIADLAGGGDSGSRASNDEHELVVFTSGEDGVPVRDAVVDILEIAGYGVTAEQSPERGSWFQRLTVKQRSPEAAANLATALTATVTNGVVAETVGTAVQGGDITVQVHPPDATHDERMTNAIARLLEASRGHDEVVVYMGSILLIKIDSSIRVWEPTDDEHDLIAANPHLLQAPRDLVAKLVGDKLPENAAER